MKKLLNFLLLAPLLSLGQGVQFENGLSWEQILAKAKVDNKYIFVDCYASWCGPCKMMDKETYPNDTVGRAMKDRFISVKVQMDTSKSDNDTVKAWYADAHLLMYKYRVGVFPSFLFFSPDGRIVHRAVGYKKTKDFVDLIADAQNPSKQYYTSLSKYRTGSKDYAIVRMLAQQTKIFGDSHLADSIAGDYIHNQLDKLNVREFCTKKDNVEFAVFFAKLLKPEDKIFLYILENGRLVDSAMHDTTFSRRFINYMATKEEITPVLKNAQANNGIPDWDRMSKEIRLKYGGAYVEENIVGGKVKWYRSKEDWKNYTRYLIEQMEIIGINSVPNNTSGIVMLNNYAWEIFQYSENKNELEKALTWINKALEMEGDPSGNNLDTKANLLYKLGRKEEAMPLEKQAVTLAPKTTAAAILDSYQKMQQNKPTWVTR